MIRRLLREYYLLPRGEQRAMLLLSLLVILSLGFRVIMGVVPDREPADLEQFQQEARIFLDQRARADSLKQLSRVPGLHSSAGSGHKSRYRSTPDTRMGSGTRIDSDTRIGSAPGLLHLNKADSVSLLKLPGIGPVFAGRIIKYRALLGGYCRVDQLSEVYGMRQETLELVTPLLVLDSSGLDKLHINSIAFRDLLRHPYLEYEHVKAIFRYIDSKGALESAEEIRQNSLLPDSTLHRIAPYLDFSH